MECLTLQTSASHAKILAGFGFNCFSLTLTAAGEPVDILWSADHFQRGTERPSGSGIPILFPFPGRIQGTVLEWNGESYELPAGDGRGNAIHGFVHERPWRVIEHGEDFATGQFQASIDDEALLACWPADFRITTTYHLDDESLKTRILIENPGDRPLPFGLGLHPYFRVPLSSSALADRCLVHIPVRRQWELDGMLTTGRSAALADDARIAGRPFAELTLDHVYGDLAFSGDQCQAFVSDPLSTRRLTYSWGQAFRYCVAYTPPHRQAICVEPYTCVPDPFRLSAAGVDAGLGILAPGARFDAWARIALS